VVLDPRFDRPGGGVRSRAAVGSVRAVLAVLAWALIVAFLPSSAWAEPTPTDSPTVTVTATETTTATATVTETATSTVTAQPSSTTAVDSAAALSTNLTGVQLLYVSVGGVLVALAGMAVILMIGRG